MQPNQAHMLVRCCCRRRYGDSILKKPSSERFDRYIARRSPASTARHFHTTRHSSQASPLPSIDPHQGSGPKFSRGSTSNSRFARSLPLLIGTLGVATYVFDKEVNASAIARTFRTAGYGALMAADFKWNFNPENSESIDALHERVARRINYICVTNGGLYIKLAQSLAIQATILPKPYREAFATVFDGAPAVSFEEVVRVFRAEFGVHPDDAFDHFSRTPVASASIAQVHKARLKRGVGEPALKEGEGWVAVKIRKPSVPKQIEWDLFAYRSLLWTYEKLFDLPISFVAKYVTLQMRKEVDLHNEAKNAEKTAEFLKAEPSLKDKVYIPKVHWQWTKESVMTADFVAATKLTDRVALDKNHLSAKQTMDIATAVFAAMTFKWGWVHCDPHPGNVLVRPHPDHPKKPQIVLIDHGLYIPLSEEFRHDYCLLWRSLFVADLSTIERIAQKWGIAKENSDMFASMTLLRPHRLRQKAQTVENNGAGKDLSKYQAQTGLKDRLRSMLENEQLIPRELIFLTRTMRMMQANNQALGSPSNRINALAHWAATGLDLANPAMGHSLRQIGVRNYVTETAQLLLFKVALLVIDFGFVLSQLRQWVYVKLGTKRGEGFEDVLQRQVTEMARNEFGVELDDTAFAG